ncbi:PREDICTED: uncharacterized protein LOC108361707 [Rhagoletis zephyria]|uniref:uncharacterized protein LOC108361707 n=1 Tax=Rhagoletis zephyria TaxID=28612 RepID=UPI000811A911|nr:PREDICTED: uncharacterized protein LOC108361707 [Rhagoletis zephyria]
MEISGIGALRTKAKYIAVVGLKSLHTGFSSLLEAVIMPSISSSQPRTTIDIVRWGIPKNINLADTSFYIPGAIDLLLGASVFFEILSVGQIKLHKNLPRLQKTRLGWIVAGALTSHSPLSSSSVLTSSYLPYNESSSLTNSSLEARLEKFWDIEDNCYKLSLEHAITEHECEEHFLRNTTRCLFTNKFIVRLPFIENPAGLGNSLETARRRFFAIERRLESNEEMRQEYKAFMNEYSELKHLVPVDPRELTSRWVRTFPTTVL